MTDRAQHLRVLEALLFASAAPLDETALGARLGEAAGEVADLLAELQSLYAARGVNLVQVAGKWALRTAPDLASILNVETSVPRKLSRASTETLAIIAYHQPVTRAEIEEIRGVALSKGTLDILLEAGWIKPKGRRATPGRPLTWVTTENFLAHFGLDRLEDLPNLAELKAAGLLDARPAVSGFDMTPEASGGTADDEENEAREAESGEAAADDREAAPEDR